MKDLIIQVLLPILLLILAGIGWLYRHEKEKRLEVEKQLSDKKYDVYLRLLSVFFNILKQVKKGQETNTQKLIDPMMDIKKEILIFGSDNVLRAFFTWEKQSQSNRSMIALAELVIAVRKDMGNQKTKITAVDFLKSLISDDAEFQNLASQGFILE